MFGSVVVSWLKIHTSSFKSRAIILIVIRWSGLLFESLQILLKDLTAVHQKNLSASSTLPAVHPLNFAPKPTSQENLKSFQKNKLSKSWPNLGKYQP
jgi:CRISPR/Cas system CSM-associated protein Csm4 (group 5 of RAMP superfamily)